VPSFLSFSLPGNGNFARFCGFSLCLALWVFTAPAALAQAAPPLRPADTALRQMPAAADKNRPAAARRGGAVTAPKQAELIMEASLTENGPLVRQGLQWRIYGANPGLGNRLPLIAQSEAALARLSLKPGDYIVFVAFGRAAISRKITVTADKAQIEKFNLNAGGLKPGATLPDGVINTKQLHFTIYTDGQINEQKPLIEDAKAGEIIRLPAGSYHIVCNYGLGNAVTRSDIRIEAGKLLEATMQQRAAQIILKLVRQSGGEALADTSWAIMNDAGDIVREIANANAYIILAEGNYVAVARNKDKIYQKSFAVLSGKDEEIEVSATAQNSVDEEGVD